MSDEFDLVATAEEEAQQSTGAKQNFGKLTIKPRYVQWVDKKPVEVNAAVYGALGVKERTLEYAFAVDIQEFNPNLKFTYERKVQIGGLDWNKILKPSLAKLAGESAVTKEELPNTLRQLNGRYVAVEDVPQVATTKNPDRAKYNTVALLKVFKTREECYADYVAVFGKETASGGSAAPKARVPIGYSLESWLKIKPEIEALHAKYRGQFPPVVALKKTGDEYGATADEVAELLGVNAAAPSGAATTPASAPAAQPAEDVVPF